MKTDKSFLISVGVVVAAGVGLCLKCVCSGTSDVSDAPRVVVADGKKDSDLRDFQAALDSNGFARISKLVANRTASTTSFCMARTRPNDGHAVLLEKYGNEAVRCPWLVVGGSLGDFRHYDMDRAMAAALEVAI